MRERERKAARLRLDKEMRLFRSALREKEQTLALLRAVRLAMGISIEELVAKSGACRSEVCRLEQAERTGAITMRALGRQAAAMGCEVVYGMVPKNGMTLERLAAMREWKEILGVKG